MWSEAVMQIAQQTSFYYLSDFVFTYFLLDLKRVVSMEL